MAINTQTHEVRQAIKQFQAMEEIARQLDDDTLLNIGMTYHGDMLRRAGKISDAMEYLEGARDITPGAELSAQGNNTQILGRAYAVRGEMQAFDRCMNRAQEIAASIDVPGSMGFSFGLGTVYEEWAKTLARQGKMKEALAALNRAEEQLPNIARWKLVPMVTRSEAYIYGGELEEGLKLAVDAVEKAKEQGHLRVLERIYRMKRYLKEQRMKFGRADDELEEALEGQVEA